MAGQRLQRLHEGRSSVTVPSVRHRDAGASEHHGHSAVMRAQCLPSTCPCRLPPHGPHVGVVRRSHSPGVPTYLSSYSRGADVMPTSPSFGVQLACQAPFCSWVGLCQIQSFISATP